MILELKDEGRFGRGPDRRLAPETVAQIMGTPAYRELAEQWMELRG